MGGFKFWMLVGMLAMLMGCSAPENQGEALALSARGGYLASGEITASCTLTADYGSRVYQFQYDVVATETGTQLTLVAPENLSGLVVTLTEDGGESQLSYEGVLVETGDLSEDGLTPVTAVPAILKAMQSGYIQSTQLEEGVLTLLCGDPDVPAGTGEEIRLTLDEAGNLLRGEIFVDGFCAIDCGFDIISWAGLPSG